jgi:hypothetical protein
MKKRPCLQFLAPALAAVLLVGGCGRPAAEEADPAALDAFLADMRAREEANKAEAINEARAEEEARRQAAEERLERFERSRSKGGAPASGNRQ